ncbi:MAG: hypothetical protein Q8K32_01905 [Archangium sp.]|nr:hypothetical protein [Archangium sp.]
MATQTFGSSSYLHHKFKDGPPMKLSWSAIFGGVVAGLGIWALLYALGLALGLSAINPNNPESAKPSGVFGGIWGIIVPLIALFIGGAIAGRGAGMIHRMGGAIHGLVMWGVTTVVGAFLLGNLLTSALGGVVSLGSGAVKAGGSMISQGSNAFGFNADDAIGPINERLQADGKPAITAAQLQSATRDVVSSAVRDGRVDRETLISSIENETALSRQDAEELAGRVQTQWDTARENVQTGALQAADATGKAFWGVFGALFLGMIAAVLGGAFGVTRRQQRLAEQDETPTVRVAETTTPSFRPPPQQPLHQ